MNLTRLKRLTEAAEGRVGHFYLDTAGHVTVGIGHLVATIDDAIKLRLEPAAAICADFRRVSQAEPGLVAEAYAHLCESRMADQDIEELLDRDMQAVLDQIPTKFPKFHTWPDGPQEATFDMAYNVGIGFGRKFPHLALALQLGDWRAAAAQCHRLPPISDERNQRTAALYLSGVQA